MASAFYASPAHRYCTICSTFNPIPMRRLVSAALTFTAATAFRLHAPGSGDAAPAGEPPAAAPAAEQRSEAAGGADRGSCVKRDDNLCDPSAGSRAVLVTAFGGSGTHSLTTMFKMHSLAMQHERVGEKGSVSWPYAVDLSHTNFAYDHCAKKVWLKAPEPPGTHFRNVYHVVRCPVDAISSVMPWSDNHCSLRYMNATLPKLGWSEPFRDGDLRFWARAWLAQNEFIESYAQRTFRLENFMDLFRQVCKDTHLSARTPGRTCENAALPTTGRRRHPDLTWADLTASVGAELVAELRSAALHYGFGEDCLEDAARAKGGPFPRAGEVVTHGIPGAECSGEPGQDCTDGLDWVWEASAVERIKRSGGASFRRAWAAV
uniref:Uncharacterized protein n=1 Tax=Alexandrium catenella TaxID=2925 RepID=A0A7S1LKP7_ALECA|mmetsp:Transcript_115704/g.307670  ORF Transcript_115704/g.307670 Transcript_115704/m.307670 type:complete len:376 (+) Transcript_115704:1-1128(+)